MVAAALVTDRSLFEIDKYLYKIIYAGFAMDRFGTFNNEVHSSNVTNVIANKLEIYKKLEKNTFHELCANIREL